MKYVQVAAGPIEILWYNANHDSLEWKNREDRALWLWEQLDFGTFTSDG